MNELLPRINELLQWTQLGPAAFADEIGVQRPIMSHIISERNKASLEVILKILARYSEVSSDWLLLGKGNMLKALDTPKYDKTDGQASVETQNPLSPQIASSTPELEKVQSKEEAIKVERVGGSVNNKVVKKVLLLYSDGSFESFEQ